MSSKIKIYITQAISGLLCRLVAMPNAPTEELASHYQAGAEKQIDR